MLTMITRMPTSISRRTGRQPIALNFSWALCLGLCLTGALCSMGPAWAKPQYWDLLEKTYQIKRGSRLGDQMCMTCHQRGFEDDPGSEARYLNAYGRDFRAQSSRDARALKSIEEIDSDGDGWTNGTELRFGTLPGDSSFYPPGLRPSSISAYSASPSRRQPRHPASSASFSSRTHEHSLENILVAYLGLDIIAALIYLKTRQETMRQVRARRTALRWTAFPTGPALKTAVSASDPAPPGDKSRISYGMPVAHPSSPLASGYTVRRLMDSCEQNLDTVVHFNLIAGRGGVPLTVTCLASSTCLLEKEAGAFALRRVAQSLFTLLVFEGSVDNADSDQQTAHGIMANAVAAVLAKTTPSFGQLETTDLLQRPQARISAVAAFGSTAFISTEEAQPAFLFQGDTKLLTRLGDSRSPLDRESAVPVPVREISLQEGNLILLCSTSLSESVVPEIMARIFVQAYPNCEAIANALLEAADQVGIRQSGTFVLWEYKAP